MEDLEAENLIYAIVEEFPANLKEEFRERDDKILKVAELKKVKQESRIMEELVQELRRTARRSSYKKRLLVEEWMNKVI